MKTIAAVLGGCVAGLFTSSLPASDWNQWRGPERTGVASGFTLPKPGEAGSLVAAWSVVVGEGHASPVVSAGRVYVFAREGEQEAVRCLDLETGRELWRDVYPVAYDMNPAARGHGKGPKSTPVVADGRVFTFGIQGHLSAYDARTGALLWRKTFGREYKETSPAFGTSVSPLVDGSRVIVHVGGEDSGALTAFDVATGQVVWKWAGDGPAYTSPIIAAPGGTRQLITQSQKRCLAVDPETGALLWEIPFTTPYDQNIVTPVVAGDLVIFGGIRNPMFAVRVSRGTPVTVWESREISQYMSSPVLDGHRLYGMSDKHRGSLFTLDATTGAVLWKSEGTLGSNASVTDVGPALLVLTDRGELTVQDKKGDALVARARYQVADAPVWASPAVVGDRLLIKGKTTLALYGFAGAAPTAD